MSRRPRLMLLAFAGGAAFLAVAAAVQSDVLRPVDEALLSAARTLMLSTGTVGPTVGSETLRDITALGSGVAVAFATLAAVVLAFASGLYRQGVALAAGMTVAGVLNLIAKGLFARVRPESVDNAPVVFTLSFPSGHAFLTMAAGLSIVLVFSRQMSRPVRRSALSLALALAFAAGVSRVLLALHWPSDVIAGWLLGIAVATAIAVVAEEGNKPSVAHVSQRSGDRPPLRIGG
jgi:undecaprenyl-diphosphatase